MAAIAEIIAKAITGVMTPVKTNNCNNNHLSPPFVKKMSRKWKACEVCGFTEETGGTPIKNIEIEYVKNGTFLLCGMCEIWHNDENHPLVTCVLCHMIGFVHKHDHNRCEDCIVCPVHKKITKLSVPPEHLTKTHLVMEQLEYIYESYKNSSKDS